MQDQGRDELIRRLLAGEDPAAIGRDTEEAAAVAEALRSLEILSLAAAPVRPSRGLKSSIMGAVTPDRKLDSFTQRTARFFQIGEARARAVLASVESVDAEPWLDDSIAGVRTLEVASGPALADATCLLVHMRPGVEYPAHRHLGDEWCLFLQGCGVEGEREWNPGDLVLKPRGSEHPVLRVIEDEPCVFGIVLYAGVEFASPIG